MFSAPGGEMPPSFSDMDLAYDSTLTDEYPNEEVMNEMIDGYSDPQDVPIGAYEDMGYDPM